MTGTTSTAPASRTVWRTRTAAAAGWVVVAALCPLQVRLVLRNGMVGLDVLPLRHAARALLDGTSVYSDPAFVYPPTAVPVLLPTAFGPWRALLAGWLLLCTVAIAVAGALAVRGSRVRGAAVLAPLAAAAMLVSDVVRESLWLGNLSLLLAPVGVGVAVLAERGRWGRSVALLVVSVLVKPLLAPFVLVPLLARRWREPVLAGLAAAAALAVASVTVPGARDLPRILRFLAGGGVLVGRLVTHNLSLAGLGDAHGTPGGLVLAARAVVVLASLAALAVLWRRRCARPGDAALAGGIAFLAVLLAGRLAENHFLVVAAPVVALGALLRAAGPGGRLRPGPLLVALPGELVLLFPRVLIGGLWSSDAALQVRFVLAEVLLWAAATALAVAGPGDRPVLERRHGQAAPASGGGPD